MSETVTVTVPSEEPPAAGDQATALAAGAAGANAAHAQATADEAAARAAAAQATADLALSAPSPPGLTADEVREIAREAASEALAASSSRVPEVETVDVQSETDETASDPVEPSLRRPGHPLMRMFLGRRI